MAAITAGWAATDPASLVVVEEGRTWIADNPNAGGGGILDTVKLRFATAATGVYVGTFELIGYDAVGRYYHCVDYVSLGDLAAGYHEISSLSLQCPSNCYLGIYFASGMLKADSSSGTDLRSSEEVNGCTGGVRADYYTNWGVILSLYASGNTGMTAPAVSTGTESSVTQHAATIEGTVSDDGEDILTERGICYSSTETTPTTADSKECDAVNSEGTFSKNLSGLLAGTTYYFRAYAINGQGTGYGAVDSFTTRPFIPSVVMF